MDIHNLAEALFGEEKPAVIGIVHKEVLGQYCRTGRPLEQIQVRVPVSFSVFPVSPDGEPASDEPAGGIPEVLCIFTEAEPGIGEAFTWTETSSTCDMEFIAAMPLARLTLSERGVSVFSGTSFTQLMSAAMSRP